jgi:DNA invertase Pin-like site-specific DNA recombinase
VQRHRASQVNQYALVQRAIELGWPRERIHVIDADLGQSGQDGQRPGFQELVAEVSLQHVGLILAYEASRLARNNADWYTLLDLAAVGEALIADADGVYDPRAYNDRLLLGLRGMLSEAELHLLRLRMDAGRLRQVEVGTYRQNLPTGLLRQEDGRVVKDPDLQIQRSIELVFSRFESLGNGLLLRLAVGGHPGIDGHCCPHGLPPVLPLVRRSPCSPRAAGAWPAAKARLHRRSTPTRVTPATSLLCPV